MVNIRGIIQHLRTFSKSDDFMQYSKSYRQGYDECLDDLESELEDVERQSLTSVEPDTTGVQQARSNSGAG